MQKQAVTMMLILPDIKAVKLTVTAMYAFKMEMRPHDLPILYKVKNTFMNTSYSYPYFSPSNFLKFQGQSYGNLALPPTWSPHRVPLASFHACF